MSEGGAGGGVASVVTLLPKAISWLVGDSPASKTAAHNAKLERRALEEQARNPDPFKLGYIPVAQLPFNSPNIRKDTKIVWIPGPEMVANEIRVLGESPIFPHRITLPRSIRDLVSPAAIRRATQPPRERPQQSFTPAQLRRAAVSATTASPIFQAQQGGQQGNQQYLPTWSDALELAGELGLRVLDYFGERQELRAATKIAQASRGSMVVSVPYPSQIPGQVAYSPQIAPSTLPQVPRSLPGTNGGSAMPNFLTLPSGQSQFGQILMQSLPALANMASSFFGDEDTEVMVRPNEQVAFGGYTSMPGVARGPYQAMNPRTGRLELVRGVGTPLAYSGDLAACRRIDRFVTRVNRCRRGKKRMPRRAKRCG